MSRPNRCLGRTTIAGLTVGVASMVAAGTAPPAGAMPAPAVPAAAVRPLDQSGPVPPSLTPACVVQGALFEPLFLGLVLVGNPSQLPSAAAGYWTGSQPGLLKGPFGDHFPGWLSHCGIAGPSPGRS
jgi:hypothetical protein